MPKSSRHTVNVKLTPEEYEALSTDAEAAGTRPTTVALCHLLAGLQRNRIGQGTPRRQRNEPRRR